MRAMFDLTPLTGQESNADRTVVIQSVEFNYRMFRAIMFTLPIGILTLIVTIPILGMYSLLAAMIVWGALLLLFTYRTTTGLKLQAYQAIMDGARAKEGVVYLCGRVIDLTSDDIGVIAQGTVPNPLLAERLGEADSFMQVPHKDADPGPDPVSLVPATGEYLSGGAGDWLDATLGGPSTQFNPNHQHAGGRNQW